MKNRIAIILLCIVGALTACAGKGAVSELEKTAAQIERALPEEYTKQTQTDVYEFHFTGEENSKMVYYICKTTYFEAAPQAITSLHTDAVASIFDANNTPLLKEFNASGHPAAIYQGENCNYICCTIYPEYTVVMAYDPVYISEEEAILVIRSIFEGPDVAKELVP